MQETVFTFFLLTNTIDNLYVFLLICLRWLKAISIYKTVIPHMQSFEKRVDVSAYKAAFQP